MRLLLPVALLSSIGCSWADPSLFDDGMIQIHGGTFNMGCTQGPCEMYESLAMQASVGDFLIDPTEVTVGDYRATCHGNCGGGGATGGSDLAGCTWTSSPGANEDLPINCVDAAEATAYCKALNKRLPHESEWEYAARGGGNNERIYPWGSTLPGCMLGNFAPLVCSSKGPTDVATHTPGDTPEHISDLTGNVTEWTQDQVMAGLQNRKLAAVIKGGSFFTPANELRPGNRRLADVNARDPEIGFRCVR
jgi:formylglycine-generating enzyme required for sulfatase activity